MGRRSVQKSKRLSKREVRELIEAGAIARRDLADALAQRYSTGHVDAPGVYELSGDRFLYVFDESDPGLGGKGNVWPRERFLRFVAWTRMVRLDAAEGRQGSVSNWHFYSRLKHDLSNHVPVLVQALSDALAIPRTSLDGSYASLDLVTRAIDNVEAEVTRSTLYDGLVAAVGEVLRARVGGTWAVASPPGSESYPYIRAKDRRILMPINVVYEQLGHYDGMDLRKAATNEVRQSAQRGWSDP